MKHLKENIDWICLAGDDYWNSNPHSRYHIAKEFAKYGKVLWINSIGHRFPSLKQKKGWKLVFNKFLSYLRYFRKPENNFYVLSPLTIPSFKSKIIFSLNSKILWFQISIICFFLRIKKKYFFISSPSFGILDKKLKNSFNIYYYSDMYTVFRELENKTIMEELDKKLLAISKIIYGASKKICESLRNQNINILYLPHAVDRKHFEVNNEIVPDDIKFIKYPIIGYYGTITDSNDWSIIDFCSKERPNYNFVFVGKKLISLPELEKRQNIFFIDKVPYKLIPHYGKMFDVAIMFWVLRDWIKHSSPLKLLEYFALKKPVVSVDIPEVKERFGDVVYLANSKEDFLNYIDLALTDDGKKRIEKYEKILLDYSWSNVVDRIYKDIEELENVK